MRDITVADFVANGGFWAKVQTIKDFPFFTTYPPANLDSIMVIKYGERLIIPKLKEYSAESLAALVVDLFSTKWERLISIEGATIDFMATSQKHLLETINHEKEQGQTGETVNKTSAYNDVSLIADSGSDSTNETTETGVTTKEVTDSAKSYEAAYKNLDTMQKMAIMSVITLDVVNTISLTVY